MLDIYYSTSVVFAFIILYIVNRDVFLYAKNRIEQGNKEYKSLVNSIGLFLLVDASWGIVHALLGKVYLYIDAVIYNITMILTIWMCCRYVSSYLELRNKRRKFLEIFGKGLFIVDVIMVIINFFTPILFWIDEAGNYQTGIVRHVGMYVQFVVFMAIAIVALYDALTAKGKSREKLYVIFFFTSFITLALCIQAIFPLYPAYSMGLVTGVIIIYVQIHVAEQSAQLEEIKTLNLHLEEKQKEVENSSMELLKLKTMIEVTNIGIWELITKENEMPRLRTDKKMKTIMGLPADSDISDEDACQMVLTRINPADVALFMEYDVRLKEGKRAECTYRWDNPVLGERYVRCGGAILSKSDDTIVTCGYHYDVTEEVKTEKELEQSIAANKAKTKFLQNMSHEIRTPLNAMFGFAQLLGMPDGTWSEEEKEKYNKIIHSSFFMLDMLINDILDSSDIQHNNYKMEVSELNVNEVGKNALYCVEFRCPDSVEMKFSSDVDDSYTMTSDAKRIQQILINFLTNACKYTEKGQITLHISNKEHPGMITFSVTDTGVGVPPEKADIIFGRYTKLDKNVQGSGLGLNICNTISLKLGGKIYLDTSYTGGARFVFELPVN